uniref:Phosphatidylethanolamine binding protein 4 n=1 Tax=Ficedula albicollis TaxID=59894 RepID=A0A803UZU1_FICAL
GGWGVQLVPSHLWIPKIPEWSAPAGEEWENGDLGFFFFFAVTPYSEGIWDFFFCCHPIPRASPSGLLQGEKYVLVMVDPDSPNRAEPRFQFWRHWMVTDILVSRSGSFPRIRGGLDSHWDANSARRPKPPRYSGYHRYQFRIYEQPEHETIALSEEERVSLGTWDLKEFVEVFSLGRPVASTHWELSPALPLPSARSSWKAKPR